jgi:hypothetical protein
MSSSRDLAILQVSIFDAVNGVNPQDTPFFVGGSAAPGSSIGAAAATAGFSVMNSLFGSNTAFTNLYNSEIGSLSDTTGAIASGSSWGSSVASTVLFYRSFDGASYADSPYSGSSAPGQWQPTPPGNQTQPLLPGWGNVSPFGINTGSQFRPNGPPTLDSQEWINDYNQVKSVGSATSSTRTADQTSMAQFWNGSQSSVVTWNKVAQTATTGLSLNDSAKVFAAVNVSMADAGISAADAKYAYTSWRPVTAITSGGGNAALTADPAWTPLINTPPSPAYVSATATLSSAAATTLAGLLGDGHAFSVSADTTCDGIADMTRGYSSFSQAAGEAGISGVYSGINFNTSIQDGQALGNAVGQYDTSTFFTPVSVPEPSGAFYILAAGLVLITKRRFLLRA